MKHLWSLVTVTHVTQAQGELGTHYKDSWFGLNLFRSDSSLWYFSFVLDTSHLYSASCQRFVFLPRRMTFTIKPTRRIIITASPTVLGAYPAVSESDTMIFLGFMQGCAHLFLKEPQAIESRVFSTIGFALITTKTQVKIYFEEYPNYFWIEMHDPQLW